MEAQPDDSDLFTLGFENLPLDHPSVETPSRDRRGEYKPSYPVTLPCLQDFDESRIKRDFVVGSLCFYLSDSPVDYTLLHQNQPCLKIDVFPAKGQQLGDP